MKTSNRSPERETDGVRPPSRNGGSGEGLRNGLTLAQRRQERRDALLDAALELFGTKGFASTSVEEICRTAFVSTRNFYEEFGNRDAVLEELGDLLVGKIYDAVVQGEVEDGPDRLRNEATLRVSNLVHALLDDPRQARIAFIESRGVSMQQEERRRAAHQLFATYLIQLVRSDIEDGTGGDRGTEVYALALVGAINELLSDWVLRDDKPPIDDLVGSIVDVIVLMNMALR